MVIMVMNITERNRLDLQSLCEIERQDSGQ